MDDVKLAFDEVCFDECKATSRLFKQNSNHPVLVVDFYKRFDGVSKHGLSLEHKVEYAIAEPVEFEVTSLVNNVLEREEEY